MHAPVLPVGGEAAKVIVVVVIVVAVVMMRRRGIDLEVVGVGACKRALRLRSLLRRACSWLSWRVKSHGALLANPHCTGQGLVARCDGTVSIAFGVQTSGTSAHRPLVGVSCAPA